MPVLDEVALRDGSSEEVPVRLDVAHRLIEGLPVGVFVLLAHTVAVFVPAALRLARAVAAPVGEGAEGLLAGDAVPVFEFVELSKGGFVAVVVFVDVCESMGGGGAGALTGGRNRGSGKVRKGGCAHRRGGFNVAGFARARASNGFS